jgi:predicted RNA-binding Zn-ribbon protein involved in translation (DUF1610 family)
MSVIFVCPKCVKGDMYRDKKFDKKIGKNKYAYICDRCGYLKYFDQNGGKND